MEVNHGPCYHAMNTNWTPNTTPGHHMTGPSQTPDPRISPSYNTRTYVDVIQEDRRYSSTKPRDGSVGQLALNALVNDGGSTSAPLDNNDCDFICSSCIGAHCSHIELFSLNQQKTDPDWGIGNILYKDTKRTVCKREDVAAGDRWKPVRGTKSGNVKKN